MNRDKIEKIFAEVALRELEDEEEEKDAFEKDGRFWVLNVPNSPATLAEVKSSEYVLGRSLPAAYREFLLFHDGWKNIQGDIELLGTSDYQNDNIQKNIGELIWTQLDALGAPLDNVSTEDFAPSVFYRVLDDEVECPTNMTRDIEFIRDFKETDSISLLAKSTIFGWGNGLILSFRGDEVLEDYAQGGVLKRHANFWFWLEYYAQWRVWRSDE